MATRDLGVVEPGVRSRLPHGRRPNAACRRLHASGPVPQRASTRALDALDVCVFVRDASGAFLEEDRRACEPLAYSREELLRLGVRDIEVVRSDEVEDVLRQVTAGATLTVQAMRKRKDGSLAPVEATVSRLGDWEPPVFVAVARSPEQARAARAERPKAYLVSGRRDVGHGLAALAPQRALPPTSLRPHAAQPSSRRFSLTGRCASHRRSRSSPHPFSSRSRTQAPAKTPR